MKCDSTVAPVSLCKLMFPAQCRCGLADFKHMQEPPECPTILYALQMGSTDVTYITSQRRHPARSLQERDAKCAYAALWVLCQLGQTPNMPAINGTSMKASTPCP